MLKNTRVILLIMFFICLYVLISFEFKNGGYALLPKINSISPSSYVTEANDTRTITIQGENFSSNISLSINGKLLDEFTRSSENSLSFFLPDRYLNPGELKISVENKIANSFDISSNSVLFTVQEGEQFKDSNPVIREITVDSQNDYMITLLLKGSGFNKFSEVYLNDIILNDIIVLDANSMIVNIYNTYLSGDYWLFNVRQNNEVGKVSNLFALNKDDVDFTYTLKTKSSTYLSNGYLIAHAFGGLNTQIDSSLTMYENSYTNSKEAFMQNYNNGHRLFECDFQFTSDSKLVAMHDRPNPIKTFAEEQETVPYTLMTFEDICGLLAEYSDAIIITDTKYTDIDNNEEVFDVINETISQIDNSIRNRIVVQVYNQPMYYFLSSKYDFNSYIYTLYQSSDSPKQIIDFIEREQIPIVTMPAERAKDKQFIKDLKSAGANVFAHTVNDLSVAYSLFDNGVYGIYTDTINYYNLVYTMDGRYPLLNSDLKNDASWMFEQIKASNNQAVIITAKNISNIDIPTEIAESIRNLGLEFEVPENSALSYLAIIKDAQVVHEELTSTPISFQYLNNGLEFNIYSANGTENLNTLSVDGIGCGANNDGINIIAYDTVNDALISSKSIVFNESGDYDIISADVGNFNRINFMFNYLESVTNSENIVVISANDEASMAFTPEMTTKLNSLNLNVNLYGMYWRGYAAVLDSGINVYEEITPSHLEIIDREIITSGVPINIYSAGMQSGLVGSKIIINGEDYSLNSRGLNIVVYNKQSGEVVDSVSFDTYEGIYFSRKTQ